MEGGGSAQACQQILFDDGAEALEPASLGVVHRLAVAVAPGAEPADTVALNHRIHHLHRGGEIDVALVDVALRRHHRHRIQRRHPRRAPGLARQRRIVPDHLLAEAIGDHLQHVLGLRGDAIRVLGRSRTEVFVDEQFVGEDRKATRQRARRIRLADYGSVPAPHQDAGIGVTDIGGGHRIRMSIAVQIVRAEIPGAGDQRRGHYGQQRRAIGRFGEAQSTELVAAHVLPAMGMSCHRERFDPVIIVTDASSCGRKRLPGCGMLRAHPALRAGGPSTVASRTCAVVNVFPEAYVRCEGTREHQFAATVAVVILHAQMLRLPRLPDFLAALVSTGTRATPRQSDRSIQRVDLAEQTAAVVAQKPARHARTTVVAGVQPIVQTIAVDVGPQRVQPGLRLLRRTCVTALEQGGERLFNQRICAAALGAQQHAIKPAAFLDAAAPVVQYRFDQNVRETIAVEIAHRLNGLALEQTVSGTRLRKAVCRDLRKCRRRCAVVLVAVDVDPARAASSRSRTGLDHHQIRAPIAVHVADVFQAINTAAQTIHRNAGIDRRSECCHEAGLGRRAAPSADHQRAAGAIPGNEIHAPILIEVGELLGVVDRVLRWNRHRPAHRALGRQRHDHAVVNDDFGGAIAVHIASGHHRGDHCPGNFDR